MIGANPTCSIPKCLGKATPCKRLNHTGLIKKKSHTMGELSSGSPFAVSRLSLEKFAVDRPVSPWYRRRLGRVLLGKDGDSDLGDSNTSPPLRKGTEKKPFMLQKLLIETSSSHFRKSLLAAE